MKAPWPPPMRPIRSFRFKAPLVDIARSVFYLPIREPSQKRGRSPTVSDWGAGGVFDRRIDAGAAIASGGNARAGWLRAGDRAARFERRRRLLPRLSDGRAAGFGAERLQRPVYGLV